MSISVSIRLFLLSTCLIIDPCAGSPASSQLLEHINVKNNVMTGLERLKLRDKAKKMFQLGFDNYMRHAYPKDELDPIHCVGRGHDHDDPHNINVNDALGDYMLTLVDSLDSLAIMGYSDKFRSSAMLIIDNLNFNTSNEVQVFEATIRVLGGLLSAHLLVTDTSQQFGNLSLPGYDNELLSLAHDLASRLLPAFSDSVTGIPHPRVNLRSGIRSPPCLYCLNETCSAGAASLHLEFGILSILLDDPVYYSAASRASKALYNHRCKDTGLIGNLINIQTGAWSGRMSGIGAGLDSVYEYMLKSGILFGDAVQMDMFKDLYQSVKYFLRKGRDRCNEGEGHNPIYINVDMLTGQTSNNWIDSLSAAWPAVQVLYGDLEEAICTHLLYYAIWRQYSSLPERYNWNTDKPELSFYPLRPELAESTYYLYRATKSPFYLDVGRDILTSIDKYNRVRCGYATMHDVIDKTLEDRMESFFLSETCKYLYLLFDEEHPLHKSKEPYLFSTEGHLFPVSHKFRRKFADIYDKPADFFMNSNLTGQSEYYKPNRGYFPIKEKYIHQVLGPGYLTSS